jgi:hypothetical protein
MPFCDGATIVHPVNSANLVILSKAFDRISRFAGFTG